MTVEELRDYEKYYSQIGFTKENSHYSLKYQKKRFTIILNQTNWKIPDPSKTKRILWILLKQKKNRKIIKQSQIISQQPQIIENPKTVDTKSVFHRKSKNFS